MSSANALIDLVSDKSSLLTTMFWFPESSVNSFLVTSAFSRSLQAMMTRAPEETGQSWNISLIKTHKIFLDPKLCLHIPAKALAVKCPCISNYFGAKLGCKADELTQ